MSLPVDVAVEVRVRIGGGRAWWGRGRDLPEALAIVRSYACDEELPQNERAAVAAALDRGAPEFTVELVSSARWWNPCTWGTVSLQFAQGARLISGPDE
jgi:hypothetical protein